MIRFLTFLLGRPYETCKSCETLKQQLALVNDEKKQLTETLLRIISPKVVEAPPIELNPIRQTSALFSRRRAALEEKDRLEAKILRESTNLGKPDDRLRVVTTEPILGATSVEALENELGVGASAEKTAGE